MKGRGQTREPIVDGIFYPGERQALVQEVNRLLAEAEPPSRDSLAVITPHAAFEYVGSLMASAFKSTAGRHIETVVILAPQHRDPDSRIVLPESGSFRTPLGSVSIDSGILAELTGSLSDAEEDESLFTEEHSIEVQLPFLQILHPGAHLVPLILGEIPPGIQRALADTLQRSLSHRMKTTLFVITSNMGYHEKGEEVSVEAIMSAIRSGEATDIDGLKGQGDSSVCGAIGLATLLHFREIRFHPDLLGHACSPLTRTGVIHYVAISLLED